MTTRTPPPDPDESIETWARRLAAELPPFTADEAAAAGRVAASLDHRIAAAQAGRAGDHSKSKNEHSG